MAIPGGGSTAACVGTIPGSAAGITAATAGCVAKEEVNLDKPIKQNQDTYKNYITLLKKKKKNLTTNISLPRTALVATASIAWIFAVAAAAATAAAVGI